MSNYRRAKLVFDSFRSTSSRLLTCSRIVVKDVTTARTTLSPPSNKPNFRGFFSSLIKPVIKTAHSTSTSPLSAGANLPRAANHRKRWLYALGSVLVIGPVCYYGRFETIPFLNRTHFVIISPNLEKKLGYSLIESDLEDEEELKGKMLPDTHPQTIRVRCITDTITEAMQREIVSDQNNKKGSLSHLVGRKYKIIVKEDPYLSIYLMHPDTIVISTGTLHEVERDEEIAFLLAREIAADMAQHAAEIYSNPMLILTRMRWDFNRVFKYDSDDYYFPNLTKYMFRQWQRMDIEADYIGMMLLASAGYDPRVAPNLLTKIYKEKGLDLSDIRDKRFRDPSFCIFPSGDEKIEKLTQALEEALSKYRDVRTRYEDINE